VIREGAQEPPATVLSSAGLTSDPADVPIIGLALPEEMHPPPEPAPNGRAGSGSTAAPYDPEHPCLTVGVMARAAVVLFWNRRPAEPESWLAGLNQAFYRLRVPCDDEDFLAQVLTTIQMESGVHRDPPLENRNLESFLDYRLATLRQKSLLAGWVIEDTALVRALRKKLQADTRSGRVRTEGQLVRYLEGELRPWLEGYLGQYYPVPDGLARRLSLRELGHPVQTLGPMQIGLRKALGNAKRRGEHMASVEQMEDALLSPASGVARGILEGVAQLWRSYRLYRRLLPEVEAVRFAAADYNAGEFSSRNAAFQERVALLSGASLLLDGDLLVYAGGRPLARLSETEAAVRALGLGLSPGQIHRDLLLEKEEEFGATTTARRVCSRFKSWSGGPCRLARLPAGAENETGVLMHGRRLTPARYVHAFMQLWEVNRERLDHPWPVATP
jgi:hypothetical protein